MSRRHVRHFYAVFDNFSKVIKIMRAYMVPPYGIRWEERRKKCFIIFPKDSHLDMQLMSRRHAEYENMLEIRQIQCLTSIHAHKMTNLIVIWYFITKIKRKKIKLHNYHRKFHFRQLSRRHAGDELKWEILQLGKHFATYTHFCIPFWISW